MQKEVFRCIELFGGIGGFKKGIEEGWRVASEGKEAKLRDSEGNQPVSEGHQESNNQGDSGKTQSAEDSSGALFQNGQVKSNPDSEDMEESEEDTEVGRQMGQGSDGILREGDGVRDESESLQPDGNKPDIERWRCVWYNDFDKYSVQTYNKNFGTNYKAEDIKTIKSDEIPNHDLICAGFPCQSFSIAGKRRGFEDTRGTLFFEIVRIAKHHRTPYLFLENVKGLLSHDEGKTFRIILETLDELGYDVQWQVLNSKHFGVPQNRERVFIIGHLRTEPRPEVFPIGEGKRKSIKVRGENGKEAHAIDQNYWKGADGKRTMIRTGNINVAIRKDGISPNLATRKHSETDPSTMAPLIIPVLTPDRKDKRQHGRRFKEDGEESFTLTGQDKHGVSDGRNIRRLTPKECERLQGFPDNWTEKGKVFKSVKLYGNVWKDVQLKDVKEKSVIENQNSVLNIIRDGKDGAIRKLSIPSKGRIKESVGYRGVIEKHIVENGVCDTMLLGKDMVMLSKVKGTLKYETLTKKSHILERMEEKSTYPLWKIILEENSKKENLSTILTLIKETILSKTFICVKTEKPITDVIIVWKRLERNFSKKESLNLEMEDTILISDTQRYKQCGNAVTVNVIKAIVEKWIK